LDRIGALAVITAIARMKDNETARLFIREHINTLCVITHAYDKHFCDIGGEKYLSYISITLTEITISLGDNREGFYFSVANLDALLQASVRTNPVHYLENAVELFGRLKDNLYGFIFKNVPYHCVRSFYIIENMLRLKPRDVIAKESDLSYLFNVIRTSLSSETCFYKAKAITATLCALSELYSNEQFGNRTGTDIAKHVRDLIHALLDRALEERSLHQVFAPAISGLLSLILDDQQYLISTYETIMTRYFEVPDESHYYEQIVLAIIKQLGREYVQKHHKRFTNSFVVGISDIRVTPRYSVITQILYYLRSSTIEQYAQTVIDGLYKRIKCLNKSDEQIPSLIDLVSQLPNILGERFIDIIPEFMKQIMLKRHIEKELPSMLSCVADMGHYAIVDYPDEVIPLIMNACVQVLEEVDESELSFSESTFWSQEDSTTEESGEEESEKSESDATGSVDEESDESSNDIVVKKTEPLKTAAWLKVFKPKDQKEVKEEESEDDEEEEDMVIKRDVKTEGTAPWLKVFKPAKREEEDEDEEEEDMVIKRDVKTEGTAPWLKVFKPVKDENDGTMKRNVTVSKEDTAPWLKVFKPTTQEISGTTPTFGSEPDDVSTEELPDNSEDQEEEEEDSELARAWMDESEKESTAESAHEEADESEENDEGEYSVSDLLTIIDPARNARDTYHKQLQASVYKCYEQVLKHDQIDIMAPYVDHLQHFLDWYNGQDTKFVTIALERMKKIS
jgi:hypothetical protein